MRVLPPLHDVQVVGAIKDFPENHFLTERKIHVRIISV